MPAGYSNPPALLLTGPDRTEPLLVLAHGAGAPMDSPFMNAITERLAVHGLRTARFEFPYMAARRSGSRRPPDRLPVLMDTWRSVLASLGNVRIVIGGKSMGGRIASLLAAELEAAGRPAMGVVCLGYPFHPPGRAPGTHRIEHLATLTTPMLILQGTRDPFGRPEEVASYPLASAVQVHWLADGDHDLKPRRSSGRDWTDLREEATLAILAFLEGTDSLARRSPD